MNTRLSATFLLLALALTFGSSCRHGEEPTSPDGGGGNLTLVWEKLTPLSGVPTYALSSLGSTLAGSDSGRIYRTTNNGRDWVRIEAGSGAGTFRAIIREIHALTFAANDSVGIFRSDDDGYTWHRSNAGLLDSAITSITSTSTGVLVAGTRDGRVYLSNDLGATWEPKYDVARAVVACAESRTGIVYFSAWGGGMYRFQKNNLVPTAVNTGLANKFITSITVTSASHIHLGSDGSAIFRSTNGGDVWVHLDAGFPNAHVSSLVVNAHDQLFAGTTTGVYTSPNDGLAWRAADSGLTSPQVLSLSIDPAGFLYAGTDGGIFRTTQSTTTVFTAPAAPSKP